MLRSKIAASGFGDDVPVIVVNENETKKLVCLNVKWVCAHAFCARAFAMTSTATGGRIFSYGRLEIDTSPIIGETVFHLRRLSPSQRKYLAMVCVH